MKKMNFTIKSPSGLIKAFLLLLVTSFSMSYASAQCDPPMNVMFDANCDGSTTISWDAVATANSYTVVIELMGLPVLTYVNMPGTSVTIAQGSLTPGTDYEYAVTANCDPGLTSSTNGILPGTEILDLPPTIAISNIVESTCPGSPDGSFDVTVNDGCGASYDISVGGTTLFNVAAGTTVTFGGLTGTPGGTDYVVNISLAAAGMCVYDAACVAAVSETVTLFSADGTPPSLDVFNNAGVTVPAGSSFDYVLPEGECGYQLSWTGFAGDNCGDAAVTATITNANLGVFPGPQVVVNNAPGGSFGLEIYAAVGTNVLTVTATDASGNATAQTFTFNVADVRAPEIFTPSVINLMIPDCMDDIPVNWTVSVTDDCDAQPTLTQTAGPAPGSTLTPGVYTVSYEAQDDFGNTSTSSFNINITQDPAPAPIVDVSGNGQFTVPACQDEQLVVFSGNVISCEIDGANPVVATDISIAGDAPLTVSYVNSQEGFAYFEATGFLAPGTYLVFVSYDGVTVDHLVDVVQDANAPATITMPGNLVTNLPNCVNEADLSFQVQISDDCDTDLSGATFTLNGAPAPPIDAGASDPANGVYVWNVGGIPAGMYTLEATYTDGGGLTTTATSVFQVNGQPDDLAPVIVYPSQDISVALDPCGPSTAGVFFEITATDNCDGDVDANVSIFESFPAGATGELVDLDDAGAGTGVGGTSWVFVGSPGVHHILVEAEDDNGNVRQEDFFIVITQEPAPETNLACISNINISLNGECSAIVTPEMLLSGNFGCLTNEDFVITIDGVETNEVTGCGSVEYMIEQFSDATNEGFVEGFAPSEWTATLVNGAGTLPGTGFEFNAANDEATMTINTGSGSPRLNATVQVPSDGTLSFDWDYTSNGGNWTFFLFRIDPSGTIVQEVGTAGAGATGGPGAASGSVVDLELEEGEILFFQIGVNIAIGEDVSVTFSNWVFEFVGAEDLEACWGNILVEDKRDPIIGVECLDASGQDLIGFYVEDGVWNMQGFDYDNCLAGITGAPAPGNTTDMSYATTSFTVSEDGDYFIDMANSPDIAADNGYAPGNGTDFYLTPTSVGLLVQGNWNPNNPCNNVLAGGFNGSPSAQPGDTHPAFVATLEAGVTYTLVSYDVAGFDIGTVIDLIPADAVFFTSTVTNLDQCIIGNIGCTQIDALLNATTFEELEALGIALPTFEDNCGIAESGFVVGGVNTDDICGDRVIDITYFATDVCGNEAMEVSGLVAVDNDDLATICDNLENFDGIQNDAFLCDGNWLRDSNGNPAPSVTGEPANQSCNIQCVYTDINIPLCGDASPARKVLRQWTCVDWCEPNNQVAECTQILKIKDDKGPEIVVRPLAMQQARPYDCEYDIRFAAPEVTDNCSDIVRVSISGPGFSGDFLNVAANVNNATFPRNVQPGLQPPLRLPVGTHTIVYEAEDGCGNVTVLETILDLRDITPPLAICEKFRVASLGSNCRVRIFADAFDDGSYDNCPDWTYTVARMRPSICYAIPEFGTPVNSARALDFRPFVDFCCDDIDASVDQRTVIFRVTDASGNTNDCMVEVEVQDKLRPVIQCPPNITVDCRLHFGTEDDELAELFGRVVMQGQDRRPAPSTDPLRGPFINVAGSLLDGVANDNCLDLPQGCDIDLQVVNSVNIDECRTGTIARIFTVTDRAGNTARCTQLVTVVNLFPFDADFYRVFRQIPGTNSYAQYPNGPYENQIPFQPGVTGLARLNLRPANTTFPTRFDIVWPADLEVDMCGDALEPDSLAANPRYVVGSYPHLEREDLCAQVGMTYDEWDFEFDAGCKKVVRLWKVIDWCQDETVLDPWMWEQIIKVIDTEGPVITAGPYEFCIFEEVCDPEPIFDITATATDNCATGDEIRWDWEVFPFGDRTQPIRRSSFPGESATVLPRGESITVSRRWPRTPDAGPAHIIKFVAEDGCGNKTTEEVPFRIRDCKKPTPICFNGLAVDLMPTTGMVNVQAVLWNAGSYDNCTAQPNLIYRIERAAGSDGQTVPSATSIDFTCDDLGVVEVNFWVGDEYGNWDFCLTYIIVQNNMGADCPDESAMIAGLIKTEGNDGVEFAEVDMLINGISAGYTNTTNVEGSFGTSVPMYNTYTVKPERNDNPRNGITVADILAIQRHILGITDLNGPYNRIAADANNDDRISGQDLVEIRRVLLGKSDMFVNNTSWRFVPSAYEFINPDMAHAEDFPESIMINPLDTDYTGEDFTGIKIGDVNNSVKANSNSLQGTVSRSRGMDLVVNEVEMKSGNVYEVAFRSEDLANVEGYQFTLNFNTDKLSFAGFESKQLELTEENFGFTMLDEGMITSAWSTMEAVDASDEALFVLKFRAKDDVNLSEAMAVSSSFTEALAVSNGVEIGLNLVFETRGGYVNGATYELYQNKPNPFANETVIGFTLPEAMSATIMIHDVTGKLVKLIEGDFASGMNNVIVKKSELPASGVLYYQLEAGDFRATKKMIIIE